MRLYAILVFSFFILALGIVGGMDYDDSKMLNELYRGECTLTHEGYKVLFKGKMIDCSVR